MCFQEKEQRKREPTCFLSWYCCAALVRSLSSFKISLRVTWIACVCSHNFLACGKTKENKLKQHIKCRNTDRNENTQKRMMCYRTGNAVEMTKSVLGSLRPVGVTMMNILSKLTLMKLWHDRPIYKYISWLKKAQNYRQSYLQGHNTCWISP